MGDVRVFDTKKVRVNETRGDKLIHLYPVDKTRRAILNNFLADFCARLLEYGYSDRDSVTVLEAVRIAGEVADEHSIRRRR